MEAEVTHGIVAPIGTERIDAPARRWQMGRGLALLGALLLTYRLWAPWALQYGPVVGIGHGPTVTAYLFMVEPGAYDGLLTQYAAVPPVAAFIAWSAFSVLGLLVCPLVWQRSYRRLARVALAIYTFWFVLVCLQLLAFARLLSSTHADPLASWRTTGATHLVYSPILQFFDGTMRLLAAVTVPPSVALVTVRAWLVIVAVVVNLAAIACLWSVRLPARASPGLPPRKLGVARAMIAGGVAVWAAGYFVAPWATMRWGAVTGPVVAFLALAARVGQSPAVGLVNVMIDQLIGPGRLRRAPMMLDPLFSLYALSLVLAGGAVLLACATWWARAPRAWLAWGTVWCALAAGVVAFLSVGVLPTEPVYPLMYSAIATGPLVSAMGLLLVVLGLARAWHVTVRRQYSNVRNCR